MQRAYHLVILLTLAVVPACLSDSGEPEPADETIVVARCGGGNVCTPSSHASCYTGPRGTRNVGVCRAGSQTCNASGTRWGTCTGSIRPSTEVCGDSEDDDCDGVVDDGCVCSASAQSSCYDGPAGTMNVGACRAGTKRCNSTGTGFGSCRGAVVPSHEVCSDSIDNDCDGVVNEGCVCTASAETTCYTGPAGTEGVGVCRAGSKTCNATGTGFGACTGSILPSAEVCGDGLDNDCDCVVDEGCVCAAALPSPCYTGPAGTEGVGVCAAGTRMCNGDGTAFAACTGSIVPGAEVCGDGLDNDCDGVIDEGCVCAAGTTSACYGGPAGTDGVGACQTGTRTCNATGTAYGACTGAVEPAAADTCGDGIDDDCDGAADEGCVCAPNAPSACYDGPIGTAGVGVCVAGTRTCDPSGHAYGACVGAVVPSVEVCGDNLDNDCDCEVDEGCLCAPGAVAPCYTGPVGTENVGICAPGTQRCNGAGTAYEECLGSILPGVELCNDGLDNDCDGAAEEVCVCTPGTQAACYDGPVGTEGVGVCTGGSQTCSADGTDHGACVGAIQPSPEVCGDGVDNDCNNEIDETCICLPTAPTSCYDGPAGTAGVGICAAGTHVCNALGTGFGECTGSIEPGLEVCDDQVDNDCDGTVDENCFRIGGSTWEEQIPVDNFRQETEPAMAGVTVILHSTSSTLELTAVVGADGRYSFDGLPEGSYYLEVHAPQGRVLVFGNSTDEDGNSFDLIDSDFDIIGTDGTIGVTPPFHLPLQAGDPVPPFDAGFHGGGA